MTLLQIFQQKGWLNGRNILADDIMNAMAIEKRKWYSIKRHLTRDETTGAETAFFSDQEDLQAQYERHESLLKLNREKGLTKSEYAELLALFKDFSAAGRESRYWLKVEEQEHWSKK